MPKVCPHEGESDTYYHGDSKRQHSMIRVMIGENSGFLSREKVVTHFVHPTFFYSHWLKPNGTVLETRGSEGCSTQLNTWI